MAAPIDIPSSDKNYLANSPVVSYGTYTTIKSEDSEGVPLQTSWTLWLDKTKPSMSASEYEHNLKKVYTFNTIQGFWAVLNNVPGVNELENRISYHLMRDERRPVWEEPYNQGGGAWRLRCYKNDTVHVWRELLLAMIGEQLADALADGDEIVGLTVSVREKMDVLQVWNQKANLALKATFAGKLSRLLKGIDYQDPLYKRHRHTTETQTLGILRSPDCVLCGSTPMAASHLKDCPMLDDERNDRLTGDEHTAHLYWSARRLMAEMPRVGVGYS